MATPHADVVILTALDEEHAAVVHALGASTRPWRGRQLGIGSVGGLDVLALPMGGVGNVSSAQAATLAISVWNPAHLLLVGIAGGISGATDDLRLGDVLIPDSVVGYEHAKVHLGGLDRRYEVVQPDQELLSAARRLEPREWALSVATSRPDGNSDRVVPRAFFGLVLSGEKVVADETTLLALRNDWRRAIGVEMEGLGIAVASYRGGPGFLVVKAVSDFADAAKNDDWHAYAAESAARFAVAVLGKAEFRPAPQRPQATPISAPTVLPGWVKVQFCRRLHRSWEELADMFEVPPHEKDRFLRGHEARELWEWLEVRDKLPLLPDVLSGLGRTDLADFLLTSTR